MHEKLCERNISEHLRTSELSDRRSTQVTASSAESHLVNLGVSTAVAEAVTDPCRAAERDSI